MKRNFSVLFLILLVTAILVTACAKQKTAMMSDAPPFGGEVDVAYAAKLWNALETAKFVGAGRIRAMPYEGMEPHGVILEQLSMDLKIGSHTGVVYVKINYMGDYITRSRVVNAPDVYMDSITVMYKRERGYDFDTDNWFWVKYKPDGSVAANPKGAFLAGRVMKGMDAGCIACHTSAEGGDDLFNNTPSHLD